MKRLLALTSGLIGVITAAVVAWVVWHVQRAFREAEEVFVGD